MPKGDMDRAGHIGHPLFILSGPIYYEFNGGVTKGSYVCRKKMHSFLDRAIRFGWFG
jgi:hypothetical protein